MSASLSAALARSRHHQLLPSKRKLDDTAAAAGSGSASPAPPSAAPCANNPSSHPDTNARRCDTSPPPPVMPPLHFFVRSSSKTLVVHAHPSDTVNSIIARFSGASPTADLRLIYQGRQLQGEETLATCEVQPDSLLHLTARLRSTRCPRAWQLANDICHPRDPYLLDSLVKEFVSLAPTPASESELSDHLDVFLLSGAPVALVRFYLSHAKFRAVADRSIRHFTADPSLPKDFQVRCLPILLEFCRLLISTAGRRDPLYQSCRGALATLLDSQEWRSVGPLRQPANAIPQLLPFAKEMADIVIAGLSSESMLISSKDLMEFSSFMRALRVQIQEWMGGVGPMPRALYSNVSACSTSNSNNIHRQLDGWIHALYSTYKELIEKASFCLRKLNADMRNGKSVVGESDNRLLGPSRILLVLTELNHFSDIYEDAEMILVSVLTEHKDPLNTLIRHAKRHESFYWLLKHRDILDFESRRNLALMMFPEGRDDYHELHEMLIDRKQLLAESFEYITQADASSLHGGLFMEFKNEEATGPGVLREWFCLVCRAIFSPQNVLFLPCANDKRRFFPNPASCVDPLHLKYFVFSGRIIALALMHRVQVGVVFDRIFYSQLSGRSITLEDIKDADPLLYTSCRKILEMDPDILDSDGGLELNFVREVDELGSHKVIELCPGGKDISVNSKNRDVYINLLIQDRFVNSISKQVAHFAQGFGDILTDVKQQKFFFSSLDLEDFDKMIGGSEGVLDVKDWKAHTEYNGYKVKDRQIGWFWKVVEQMPPEKQRMLLFFWTSVKYLPAEGFGGLGSKLYIYKSTESQTHLPTSHTCFYRLCLPAYSSMSTMRSRLSMITQEYVSCTFGTW